MGLISVSKNDHAGYGVKLENTDFLANWDTIPLASYEMMKILHWGVACFKKQRESYQLSLLTGFVPNMNIFLHPTNKKLMLPYVPASVRSYPFRLVTRDEQSILTVLDNEPGFCAEAPVKILDDEGQLTEKGQSLMGFLSVLEKKYKEDRSKVDWLAENGLLKPFKISQTLESGETKALRDDLYIIDEAKFAELSDADIAYMVKSGIMRLAYLQMMSMENWESYNRYSEAYVKLLTEKEAELPDVESFFGGEDDVLNFGER